MKKDPLILEHYDSKEKAERARSVLEEAGLHPRILDEGEAGNDGMFALQVPESEVDESEAVLGELEQLEGDAGNSTGV